MAKFLQPILDWWEKITARATAPSEDALAGRGENTAARYLRQIGYKIILRNYRSALGEIDIIARDGDTLVFVEVKTRAYDDPTPEEQVNTTKQHQITKAAKTYLNRYGSSQPPARFDVVAVVWPADHEPIVRHIQNAFEATF
ncbi:MAG TPA: YraN family protein [Tepidisphaeraceae bacterium]|nr:YraN family protein [Tepidisphaeraceae bacterium]